MLVDGYTIVSDKSTNSERYISHYRFIKCLVSRLVEIPPVLLLESPFLDKAMCAMVRQTRVHCPLDDWMMVLILLLGIRIVIVSIFTIGWMTIPHLYVIYVIYVYHI